MEPLELHVWGPAFGLPSVDAECLAAIAYLHTALPSSEWRLVPSNDPAVDTSKANGRPLDRLPALHANGVWVTGYASIVSHLRTTHSLDLDSRLTPSERADALALAAHVDAHLAPLLDAYLYADHDNWAAVTRPALSQILGFPLSWTVPVLLRQGAEARSAHLGFGSLGEDDDDDAAADGDVKAGQGTLDRAMKHLPVSGQKSVMEEMRARTARGIRLHAVTVDALAPLEEQRAKGERTRGEKMRFFGGDAPTSLDCLVFGHLVLVQAAAAAPEAWLLSIFAKKFPHLNEMVHCVRDECLPRARALPWAPAPPSALRTAARLLDTVVQHTPNLGEFYLGEWRRRAETKAAGVADRRTVALAGGVLAAGTAIAYGVWTYRSLPPWGARTMSWDAEKGGLRRFGELGAMLDFSFGLADAPRASAAAGWGGGDEHRVVEQELSVD
ncbi:Metaxin-like protein [Colletotrichum gloeosporioides]|uniref:Metaxin-like protein n=1 Tax=Colletotrichum gloeosporioides TaxID=474922 RepID=A0A8H4CF33_COLGL|nr:Metaxin-like protein [Colletotrichum gloeosporioides]KAF3802875.1 Metaxin-like protein [Colletotrichum gloeosporioides]